MLPGTYVSNEEIFQVINNVATTFQAKSRFSKVPTIQFLLCCIHVRTPYGPLSKTDLRTKSVQATPSITQHHLSPLTL